MKCIIIDDEPLAREELQLLIQQVSDLEIIATFTNAIKALDYVKDNEVDLIFLDIEMPGLNGLNFAQKIPQHMLIIFTTAYPQHAAKSYDLDAIDYLLKPIEDLRLVKAIEKAKLFKNLLSTNTKSNESNSDGFIFIKSERKFYKIRFSDINYIEGLKDYVILYTSCAKLITAMNLKTIHKKLPDDIFYRVSKSFIINKNQIDAFDHNTIYIKEIAIPIGNVYREDFLKNYADDLSNLEL